MKRIIGLFYYTSLVLFGFREKDEIALLLPGVVKLIFPVINPPVGIKAIIAGFQACLRRNSGHESLYSEDIYCRSKMEDFTTRNHQPLNTPEHLLAVKQEVSAIGSSTLLVYFCNMLSLGYFTDLGCRAFTQLNLAKKHGILMAPIPPCG
jgi:hypothetical protein